MTINMQISLQKKGPDYRYNTPNHETSQTSPVIRRGAIFHKICRRKADPRRSRLPAAFSYP